MQGHGTTRAELNMHLTPSRDGEHLYQLKEGEKVEVLKRATTDKNAPKPPKPPKPVSPSTTPAKVKEEKPSACGICLASGAKTTERASGHTHAQSPRP